MPTLPQSLLTPLLLGRTSSAFVAVQGSRPSKVLLHLVLGGCKALQDSDSSPVESRCR